MFIVDCIIIDQTKCTKECPFTSVLTVSELADVCRKVLRSKKMDLLYFGCKLTGEYIWLDDREKLFLWFFGECWQDLGSDTFAIMLA